MVMVEVHRHHGVPDGALRPDAAAALAPSDPSFPAYQQFLHLGESRPGRLGLFRQQRLGNFAPEAERNKNGTTVGLHALETYETRLRLVTRQAGPRALRRPARPSPRQTSQ